MEKITDKYYLDSDKYQYIVVEKSVVSDENSVNYGREKFDNVAYCNTLNQVRTFLFEQCIKDDLTILNNIDSCIKLKELLNATSYRKKKK